MPKTGLLSMKSVCAVTWAKGATRWNLPRLQNGSAQVNWMKGWIPHASPSFVFAQMGASTWIPSAISACPS